MSQVSYSSEDSRMLRGSEGFLIFAVGDIMLSGSARTLLEKKGYDHAFSDIHLSRLIKSADVAYANLEYPITRKGQGFKDKEFLFKGSEQSLKALKDAGFDILSIANNHIMDYGDTGLFSTLNACRKYGIICTGAGKNSNDARRAGIIERRSRRVALLSYSMTFPKEYWAKEEMPGTAYGEKSAVSKDVRLARERADIVIVGFHWGAELMAEPRAYQTEMAHHAIDSGADMVFGHHPHVPQPVEIYKGRPVFYSLGNYAFGSYSKNSQISFAAMVTMGNEGVKCIKIYPVIVDNYKTFFRPQTASKQEAFRIIEYLNRISEPYGTKIGFYDGFGIIEP